MQEELVSIIIPVYNVEKYIRQCLDSVINQTYRNIEIILINDGSTDNSGKICEEYAKKDNRIVLLNKPNGGLSSARNAGIEKASGQYLTFVDSDDTIEPDAVEYLYNILKKFDCKLAVCTHNVIKNNKIKKNFNIETDYKISAQKSIEKMLYDDKIDTSAWAKLYRRELFKEIRYPEGILFEDIATTYKLFIKAEEIACGKEAKYNYKIRNNSIVTGKFNKEKLDLIKNTDEMGKEILKIYPKLNKAVLRRRVYSRFSTLNQILSVYKENIEQVKEITDFIKKHTLNLLTDLKVPLRDKTAIILLNINFNVYKFVWQKIV